MAWPTKNRISILDDIKQRRICSDLDFIETLSDDSYCLETAYFGAEIRIECQYLCKAKVRATQCTLMIKGENGSVVHWEIFRRLHSKRLVTDITQAINKYIKSRPFTIIAYNRGQHRLLDPNGMDYIGQYVTLKDVKRTAFYNYV